MRGWRDGHLGGDGGAGESEAQGARSRLTVLGVLGMTAVLAVLFAAAFGGCAHAPATAPAAGCPEYYRRGVIEAKDVVIAFELTWATGNAVTYLLRAGKKTSDPREDLRKARDMIDIELARLGSK